MLSFFNGGEGNGNCHFGSLAPFNAALHVFWLVAWVTAVCFFFFFLSLMQVCGMRVVISKGCGVSTCTNVNVSSFTGPCSFLMFLVGGGATFDCVVNICT